MEAARLLEAAAAASHCEIDTLLGEARVIFNGAATPTLLFDVLERAVRASNVRFLKRVWALVEWRHWAPLLDRLLRVAIQRARAPDGDACDRHQRIKCLRTLLYAVKMTRALPSDEDLGIGRSVVCMEYQDDSIDAPILSNGLVIEWRVRDAPNMYVAPDVAAALAEHFCDEFERHETSTMTLSRDGRPPALPPAEFAFGPPPEDAFAPLRRALSKTMTRTIAGYGLIGAGDHVMVAVSGGKDSYTLLTVLLDLQWQGALPVELIACKRQL